MRNGYVTWNKIRVVPSDWKPSCPVLAECQDTIADKLFPRWLLALAETPGSQIETLNRAERLGVLTSTEQWLEARNLPNRLIHEYMTDPARFAEDLMLAREYSLMLLDTFNRMRRDAIERRGMQRKACLQR